MKTYGRMEVQLHLLLSPLSLTWLRLILLTSALKLEAASSSDVSVPTLKIACHAAHEITVQGAVVALVALVVTSSSNLNLVVATVVTGAAILA
jgi:hypothetical protein